MNLKRIALVLCAVVLATGIAFANPVVTYHFDENGNGIGTGPGGTLLLPGSLAFDPGPGGLASALSYSGLGNPPSLVAGDVLVFDAGNVLSDVIRFNPAGTGGNPAYRPTLVFYSAIDPTTESTLADTGFPIAFYANTVNVLETALPGGTGFSYTPLAGQPGYVAGFDVTYNMVSDVPEPSSLMLLGSGLAGFAGVIRRKLNR